LAQGRVLSLTAQPHDHKGEFAISTVAHLAVQYSADAPSSAPAHILWKYYTDHNGAVEVSFYNLVATLPEPVPGVVPCYNAVYNPQSGESHCLLADLSATHMTPITRAQVLSGAGVPSPKYLEQIVTSLA